MRFDFVVIGSATVDLIIRSNELKRIEKIVSRKQIPFLCLRYGSKIEMDHIEFDPGGSGHNIATGLAKLGNKVATVAKVGRDERAKLIFSSLKRSEVDTSLVTKTNKAMTGFSIILIEPKGERSIIVYRGANNFLSENDIKESTIKNSRFLVFTSMLTKHAVLAVKKAVEIAEKNQVCVVANPSISMIKNNRKETTELLKKSHIVIVNEEEASFITNASNVKDALRKLRSLGPSLVVVTLGAKGAVAFADKIYRQKAFKVKTVDTTGAGDTFSAGFLHYIAKEKSVKEALKFACATAAINITTYGATKEFPSERKILKFIKGG